MRRSLPLAVLPALVLAAACGGEVRTARGGPGDRGPGSDGAAVEGAGGGAQGGVVAAGGSPVASTADWPMLGHGPGSSFHNAGETVITSANVGQLQIKWERDVEGVVQGAVAVVDGVVYAASSSHVYAWTATTGAQLWAATGFVGVTASVAVDDGLVYVNGAAGTMHALGAETGEEAWRSQYDTNETSAGWSSPMVVGNAVLVGISSAGEIFDQPGTHTFRGGVAALDKKTGAVLWRSYTASERENGCSVWATPSVDLDSGLVFAPTGNNYTGEAGPGSDALFAFDLVTGAKRWSHQFTAGDVFTVFASNGSPELDLGANPVVFDATVDGTRRKLVGVGQKSGDFHVRDRLTGAEVWSVKLGGGGSAPPMGAFNSGAWDGERLLVLENDPEMRSGILFGLDPSTGDTIWSRPTGEVGWSPVTVAGGVGYASRGRTIEAFDATYGGKLFELTTAGTISSAPVVSNGSVYFGAGVAWLGATSASKVYALSLP